MSEENVYTYQESITIEASAQTVYDIVSDIT